MRRHIRELREKPEVLEAMKRAFQEVESKKMYHMLLRRQESKRQENVIGFSNKEVFNDLGVAS